MSSDLSRDLVAMAPAGALVNDDGEISVPFSVSGTWPNVQTTVDVERRRRHHPEAHRFVDVAVAQAALLG